MTRLAAPKLVCVACSRPHPWALVGRCEACGGLLDVEYDLQHARLRAEGPPMQRFRDLLPLRRAESLLDGGEGNTRCFHARDLGRACGLHNLWVKVEGDNPTRSVKDRQGTVVTAALRELGVRSVVVPSTGNTCTAMARIVARFPDLHLHIFVGAEFLSRVGHAEVPNVTVYWLPRGSFVEACEAAAWFASNAGYTRDGGFFFFAKREALKTVYLEAATRVPRQIEMYVQGVSSGIGVYATRRAARELQVLGHTRGMPRLVCVQESSCNAMVRAFARGATAVGAEDIVAHPHGLAKAALRGDPSATYPYVRAAVLASGGTMVSVDADALMRARAQAMETEGLDICYTAAMTIAAARNLAASGCVRADALVLLNLTGADRAPSTRAADFVVERQGKEWAVTPEPRKPHDDIVGGVIEEVRRSQELPEAFALDAGTALLETGLALDSVAVLELLLAVEKRFGQRIEEHEVTIANLRTIGTLAELVAGKLAKSPAGDA